jgi:hypothetical protein
MCKVFNCPNYVPVSFLNQVYCQECKRWNEHAKWYNDMKDKEEEEKNDKESNL